VKLFAWMRAIALLRRLTRAAERIALAQMQLANIEQARFDKETRKKLPKQTEFGSLDINEANQRWAKEQEAAAVGVELEER